VWQTRGEEILKLLSQYREIKLQEEVDQLKDAPRDYAEMTPLGTFTPDFPLMVKDFFGRVQILGNEILPRVEDLSVKLETYQKKFDLKNRLTQIFIVALVQLFVGIVIPLFLGTYSKNISPHIQAAMIFVTVSPYFFYLFFYLAKVVKISIP
jgi:hypothetical protein